MLAFFSTSQGWTSDLPVMLADANGDHVMDIVGIKDRTVYVALGNGNGKGVFGQQQVWMQSFGNPGDNYLSADLNGDGNADLMAVTNEHSIQVALSKGTSFDSTTWKTPNYKTLCGPIPVTSKTPVMVTDVNGDGLTDIVGFCDAVYVTLSNGQGFEATEKWNTTFAGPSWSDSYLRMLADLNGDGLADLVGVTGSGVIAAISNGRAFLDSKWSPTSLPWGLTGGGAASVTTRLMADANGDGLMDMVGIGDTNVNVGLAAGQVPDLLSQVTRAAGASYSIQYAPLSDPDVYQQVSNTPGALAQFQNFSPLDSGADIPTFRSGAQLGGFYHVVKSFTTADNPAVDQQTAFTYTHQMKYQDGEMDLDGRGWLGFSTVITDNMTGTSRTAKSYLREFPFTGRLTGTTVFDRSQNICNNTPQPYSSKTVAYLKVQTATSSSSQATPVYWVGRASEQTARYQKCAVANRRGVTYSYDTFGNVALMTNQNLIDAKGNPIDQKAVVFVLNSYLNDTAKWRLGLRLFSKTSTSSDASDIEHFHTGTDISLRSSTYDGRGNLATTAGWDSTNNLFLTNKFCLRHLWQPDQQHQA